MGVIRVQAIIPRDTGLPEDVSVNTWHFLTALDPAPPAVVNSIFDALGAFYVTIGTLLAGVNSNPVRLQAYDLNLPPPRPVLDFRDVTVQFASSALPEEVAMVLSFQGNPIAGVPQRRRRGRVYIGPLGTSPSTILGGRVIIASASVQQLIGAANDLLDASQSSNNAWIWSINTSFPPIAPGQPRDPAQVGVESGWVDNSFDTQRRRGPEAGARVTFPD